MIQKETKSKNNKEGSRVLGYTYIHQENPYALIIPIFFVEKLRKFLDPYFGLQKLGECDKMRSVNKIMRCYKKTDTATIFKISVPKLISGLS